MKYAKNQIKRAGKIIREKQKHTPKEIEFAEDVLTYWRTLHGELILNFEKCISDYVFKADPKAFIAKRLKRSPTIIKKLKRLNHIQLSTMQDIAGMRVVVSSMSKLKRLVSILGAANFEHELKGVDDYIENPKKSGYRGIHFIYKYQSNENPHLNGLLIEVQIRTYKQHSWATTVETMGTYLNSHLKFNEGKPKWLNYFALTSSAFAFLEKTNQIPNYTHLNEHDTYKKAIHAYKYNKVEDSLKAYTLASELLCDAKNENATFYIVRLDSEVKKVYVTDYTKDQLSIVNETYTKLEKKYEGNANVNIVLVSTDGIQKLREAYPNYFLDTREFVKSMQTIQRNFNNLQENSA